MDFDVFFLILCGFGLIVYCVDAVLQFLSRNDWEE